MPVHPNHTEPDRASRAAEVAAIYLGPINGSRKRAGLEPLAAAELEREYADLDRLPPPSTKRSRRDAGNLAALRSGGPVDQAGIDAMWAGLAAKLNAALPESGGPIGARRPPVAMGGGKPTQAETDGMWGSIAARLNAESGLRPPARRRA